MRCKYLIRATLAPGDVVIAKAKEDAASGLAKKLNELGQAIDKAPSAHMGVRVPRMSRMRNRNQMSQET